MRTLILTLLGASNTFSLTSWASARAETNGPTISTRTTHEAQRMIFILDFPLEGSGCFKKQNTHSRGPKTVARNPADAGQTAGAGSHASYSDSRRKARR